MQKIYVFILFIYITIPSNGQLKDLTPNLPRTDFYHLQMPEGIEQNSIKSIAKDSLGQMWFATDDGVIRYDGQQMIVYKNNPNNVHTLGSNRISDIKCDNKGHLWFATNKGLYEYRPESDDFVASLPGKYKNAYTGRIQVDSRNNLWIVNSLDSKLLRFNPDTNDVKVFDFDKHIRNLYILNFVISSSNLLYITTLGDSFLEFNPESEKILRIQIFNQKEMDSFPKIKNYAPHINIDHNGHVLVGTNFGFLLEYDPKTKQSKRLYFKRDLRPRTHLYTTCIFEDKAYNLWVGTWFDGVYKIFPDRKTMMHLLPDKNNSVSLSNDIVEAVYQDEAGYIWLGTEFAGVNIVKKNKKFYVLPQNKNSILPDRVYMTVEADSTRIWVGTDSGGLYFIDRKNNNVHYTGKSIVPDATRIFSLYIDKQNRLWIGTENGLYRYDLTKKTNRHFPYIENDYEGIGIKNIISICEDKNGHFWFGGIHRGLTKYDPVRQKFYRFLHEEDDKKSLSNNYVSSIFCDRHNDIWVGTSDGLNKWNRQSGNFTVFRPVINDTTSISSPVINNITGDRDYLWIATKGGGLCRYDLSKKSFKRYGKKQGLPSDNIRGIVWRNKNEIWFSTPHNIVKFNPETGKKDIYTASDGLQNNMYVRDYGAQKLEFLETLDYIDRQGYIYFGGVGGFVYFHPDSLPQNNYKSPVILTRIKVNGKAFPIKQKISLQPEQNHLSFDMRILNFIQPDKNQYAWRLDGFDSDWQYGRHRSQAEYYNLPAGNYTFRYKAANNDGVWNTGKYPLKISISPPFYQTTAFYIGIGAFVLLLVLAFAFYRWYIKWDLERKRQSLKYSKSNLDKDKLEEINRKLTAFLEKEDVYLDADLSIQKLAKLIGTKPNYLSQVINQYYQKHFRDFINTYRIEVAKKLLVETDLIIEAIAFDTGFNSASTFYTAFKKETGTTPTKYRKTFRK